jgi:hypothetical protein
MAINMFLLTTIIYFPGRLIIYCTELFITGNPQATIILWPCVRVYFGPFEPKPGFLAFLDPGNPLRPVLVVDI